MGRRASNSFNVEQPTRGGKEGPALLLREESQTRGARIPSDDPAFGGWMLLTFGGLVLGCIEADFYK